MNAFPHMQTQTTCYRLETHALQECLKRDLMHSNSLTSSELFKHQVEFVFLFKELHQLQDVASEKGKKAL